ncbi:MAG: phage Gp37/Gp68 family protein [Proteobacteria bacterium]|nr:phage Gp37/Gp68 family protein [Pseudomonadota bacterium]
MAENTSIEWCDATFNPWMGCTKVSIEDTGGGGCDHCYAEHETPVRVHRGQGRELWGAGAPRVRTSPANWRQPERWNAQPFCACPVCGWRGDGAVAGLLCPNIDCSGNLVAARRRVFCASLADVFDNEVPVQWRRDLFALISQTPNLDWLLLTKRIGNAKEMIADAVAAERLGGWRPLPWPWPNVWLGATVVNQKEADRDIPKLLATPAAVRFLSMEPLLGLVTLRQVHSDVCEIDALTGDHGVIRPLRGRSDAMVHWVIAGGESGHGARPMHPDWARSLRNQCDAAGVAFLFKQWGEWAPNRRTMADCAATTAKPLAVPLSDATPYPMAIMDRVGKKAAGRLLDGKTHDGFPEVRNA